MDPRKKTRKINLPKGDYTIYEIPDIKQDDTSGIPFAPTNSFSAGSIGVAGWTSQPDIKADFRKPKDDVVTADEVARYIIWHTKNNNIPINNLKLQMLLYYAQGWHLALYEKKLFSKPIEAWVYGPIVPSIYSKYKDMFKDECFTGPDANIPLPQFIGKNQKHLPRFFDNLFDVFMSLDAFTLERMTHNEPPWIEARADLEPDEISENQISCDTMQKYFKSLMIK